MNLDPSTVGATIVAIAELGTLISLAVYARRIGNGRYLTERNAELQRDNDRLTHSNNQLQSRISQLEGRVTEQGLLIQAMASSNIDRRDIA